MSHARCPCTPPPPTPAAGSCTPPSGPAQPQSATSPPGRFSAGRQRVRERGLHRVWTCTRRHGAARRLGQGQTTDLAVLVLEHPTVLDHGGRMGCKHLEHSFVCRLESTSSDLVRDLQHPHHAPSLVHDRNRNGVFRLLNKFIVCLLVCVCRARLIILPPHRLEDFVLAVADDRPSAPPHRAWQPIVCGYMHFPVSVLRTRMHHLEVLVVEKKHHASPGVADCLASVGDAHQHPMLLQFPRH
eukprot:1158555-Rhodomonas_salina.1